MIKCCVCGEFIDEEHGDVLVADEETGLAAHEDCLAPMDGYEVVNLRAWESNARCV